MHRQPRRIHSHPQYKRGTRLNAGEVREARQGKPSAQSASEPSKPASLKPAAPPIRPPIPKPEPVGRRWGVKRMALIGIPLVLLVASGAVVIPFLWKAHNAANKIFVPPPPQYEVVQNANGTPVVRIKPTAAPQPTQPPLQQAQQAATATPVPVIDTIPNWDGKSRVNILLLGVDDRGDTTAPPRSDTMILVSIDPQSKTVGMVSIPRDLLVTIPGYGQDKINAAYPYGSLTKVTGPGLAMLTVQYNFNINIDYYAEVNFTGFQKIVDTLGGVTLDVPAPLKDDAYPGALNNYTRVVFHTGLQHMDGVHALEYARTRHDDNDFARGIRQQQVLRQLRAQGTQLGLITKAPTLVDELANTVHTDLSLTQTLSLAKLATQMNSSSIHSYNLLSAVTESNTAAGYYLLPDWKAIGAIMDQAMRGNASASPTPGSAPTPTAASPDYAAKVLVQNATQINRLASNSSDLLVAEGFTSVTPAQAPNSSGHTKTSVVDYSGNLATAQRIAEILNLPASDVSEGDSQDAGSYDVVVTLGSDAPIPTPSP